MKTYPLFIVSGKHPWVQHGGGYGTYAAHLAHIANRIGFRVRVISFDKLPFASPIALFPILSVVLAQKLVHHIGNTPAIVWGVGPWSFTGVLVKYLWRKPVITLAHYATSLDHEFSAGYQAVNVADYGLFWKLKLYIASITIIPFLRMVEGYLLHHTDYIITHYNSTEKILQKDYGLSKKRFVQLPYSTPIRINIKPTRTKHPLILLICRHDPRKGINILLHALTLLNRRGVDYRAIIAGDGPLYNAHRRLAHKLNLANVSLPGFVQDTSILLRQASLYVFPSTEEGNSAFSILEAMATGLPIISTNVDGIPEDIKHGISGLLVEPRNPKALADAMEYLLTHPRFAQKLGKGARKRFQSKFTPRRVTAALKGFLTHIRFV